MRYIKQDIAKVTADVLVNASNSKGWMGGFWGRIFPLRGVAESMHYASKGLIEKEAKAIARKARVRPGEVFISRAHNLNAKIIIHAVTMKKPGQKSSLEIVARCLENVLVEARKLNVTSLAIPLLGTGTGRVSKEKVKHLYDAVLSNIEDLDILVVEA